VLAAWTFEETLVGDVEGEKSSRLPHSPTDAGSLGLGSGDRFGALQGGSGPSREGWNEWETSQMAGKQDEPWFEVSFETHPRRPEPAAADRTLVDRVLRNLE
jgi:hypothetical protein